MTEKVKVTTSGTAAGSPIDQVNVKVSCRVEVKPENVTNKEPVYQDSSFLPKYVATNNTGPKWSTGFSWSDMTVEPAKAATEYDVTPGKEHKDDRDMKGKYPISLQKSAAAVVAALSEGFPNKNQRRLAIEVISDLMRQNKTLRQQSGADGELKRLQSEVDELKREAKLLTKRLQDTDDAALAVIEQIVAALGGNPRLATQSLKSSASARNAISECPPHVAHMVCCEAMPAFAAARKRLEEVVGLQDLRRSLLGEDAETDPLPIELECLKLRSQKKFIRTHPSENGLWLYRPAKDCHWQLIDVKTVNIGSTFSSHRMAQFCNGHTEHVSKIAFGGAQFLGPYEPNDPIVVRAESHPVGYYYDNPTSSPETEVDNSSPF